MRSFTAEIVLQDVADMEVRAGPHVKQGCVAGRGRLDAAERESAASRRELADPEQHSLGRTDSHSAANYSRNLGGRGARNVAASWRLHVDSVTERPTLIRPRSMMCAFGKRSGDGESKAADCGLVEGGCEESACFCESEAVRAADCEEAPPHSRGRGAEGDDIGDSVSVDRKEEESKSLGVDAAFAARRWSRPEGLAVD
jgi:hypothetical protein